MWKRGGAPARRSRSALGLALESPLQLLAALLEGGRQSLPLAVLRLAALPLEVLPAVLRLGVRRAALPAVLRLAALRAGNRRWKSR